MLVAVFAECASEGRVGEQEPNLIRRALDGMNEHSGQFVNDLRRNPSHSRCHHGLRLPERFADRKAKAFPQRLLNHNRGRTLKRIDLQIAPRGQIQDVNIRISVGRVLYFVQDGFAADTHLQLRQVFEALQLEKRAIRIGAVGLGTGSVSAYVRPGDRLTFFEIDPLVLRISTDPAHSAKVGGADRFGIVGLAKLAPGSPVKVVLRHADGTTDEISCRHTLNAEQVGWFRAGSALNVLRSKA